MYLFLARPAWDSAVGIQIPVQAHVKGIVHNDTAPPHKFDHYYNFIHFSPYASDVHAMNFEVSFGVPLLRYPLLCDFGYYTPVLLAPLAVTCSS